MAGRTRVNKNDPASLRAEAARLRAYSARLNNESRRASDNAPGSYVTGASGRTRAMNRRTEWALEKTITNAGLSVAARKRANVLEMRAAWLENGGPERERQMRLDRTEAARLENQKARAAIRELKAGPLESRLFAGVYPTGLMFCDKTVEVHGDYKQLALLYWGTMVLKFWHPCPANWKTFLQGYAATYQTRIGDPFNWSSTQVGTLGFNHGEDLVGRLFERDGATWEIDGRDASSLGYICRPLDTKDHLWTTRDIDFRPLILAYEAAHATGDHPIITGPDDRTYPRLEYKS